MSPRLVLRVAYVSSAIVCLSSIATPWSRSAGQLVRRRSSHARQAGAYDGGRTGDRHPPRPAGGGSRQGADRGFDPRSDPGMIGLGRGTTCRWWNTVGSLVRPRDERLREDTSGNGQDEYEG